MAGRPPLGDEARTHIVSAALNRGEWEALQRVQQVRYHLQVLDEEARRRALGLGPIPDEHFITKLDRQKLKAELTASGRGLVGEIRARRRLHRQLRRDSTLSRIVRDAIVEFLAREDPERAAPAGESRRRGGRRTGTRHPQRLRR